MTRMTNKRKQKIITYKGERKTLSEWSKQIKIPIDVLRCRIFQAEWSTEKAFETPYVNSKSRLKDGSSVDMRILMQYVDLVEELKEVDARIAKTESEIAKIKEEGTVRDTVKGGSGGKQIFKVEGFPDAELSRKQTLLYSRKAIQSSLRAEIAVTLNKIEEFLNAVNDSRMRRIIDLRIMHKKSWNEIADAMGGNSTGDSVRMELDRFMKKNY